jgi:hypothetical protein
LCHQDRVAVPGVDDLVDLVELEPDATVVTIFPDSNKKYLSTDLCRAEPVGDKYLAAQIDLIGFRAVRHPARA